MGNVHRAAEPRLRQTDEYKTAKSLYEQHRLAQARIQEINRQLRKVRQEDPEAVRIAQADVPFRRPHGRTKGASQNGGARDSELEHDHI